MTSPSDFYVRKHRKEGEGGKVLWFFPKNQTPSSSLFVELISRWSMALGLIARVNEQRPRYVAG